ncbi:filamentous hemagglutinin N-terminal domain-containing protein [Noviherbaspirillum sp. DKR-6]|uniref:Filamentous hemagglutinin N-terminal domain-containing protein n=1 Tax=Noviherbaspirillum pedocola TaxID=2801341 RepID=A0A934STE4_9BURK|nr:filamentous hemagglutinin N-terminal domain-containing protein [Noviherbaspirillum pedocola]
MNHFFCLIWSEAQQSWIAVDEHARTRGKAAARRRRIGGTALVAALLASVGHAGPTGGVIAGGTGAINQAGSVTTINQSSSRMAINWNSFSTAAGESIVFRQPDANAIALNRIVGAEPSRLFGSLSANGQVFIVNPNGVLFGPGAQVNVQGLLASSLDLAPDRFMAGLLQLEGGGVGGVLNQGALNAASGGYVALLGPNVRNEGTISAPRGAAVMAAGDRITVNIDKGSLLGYSVDAGSLNALADNSGRISADGGRVMLEAKAAGGIGRAVVNHSGIIEAKTLEGQAGEVRLIGDMQAGQLVMSGSIDASAPAGGDGGHVETSAAKVRIDDSARVTTLAPNGRTGSWLIDPGDVVIDANQTDPNRGFLSTASLTESLKGTTVTVDTQILGNGGNGDIFVNAGVSWTSGNTLVLTAARDIQINAPIAWSGSPNIVLSLIAGRNIQIGANLSGANGKLALTTGTNSAGSDYVLTNGAKITLSAGPNLLISKDKVSDSTYEVITDLAGLQSMPGSGGKGYALGQDIDAGATAFTPITSLGGIFDGLGHVISNLTINDPVPGEVGLFRATLGRSVIQNLRLEAGSVTGIGRVGALAGRLDGKVNNVVSTVDVDGASSNVGGLVGLVTDTGAIVNSHASGAVRGQGLTGGLVGINFGTISGSDATGNVQGGSRVGGLVGANVNNGRITGSYAGGSVDGTSSVGGLAGSNENAARITDSYANAGVTGQNLVGGLVGSLSGGAVTNAYATGAVRGTDAATTGGLVGNMNRGVVSASYWNKDAPDQGGTGQSASAAGIGVTGDQMKSLALFRNAGWSIDDQGGTNSTWRIYDGYSMPLLRSMLKPITLKNTSVVYNAATRTGDNGGITDATLLQAASGRNAGTYSARSTSQTGYDISGGGLTITPAALNISGLNGQNKVYDGTTAATVNFQYTPLGADQVGISYTANFADKNVGTHDITVGNLGLTGSDAGNYRIANAASLGGTSAAITPLPLSVIVNRQDKVYDGTTAAQLAFQYAPGEAPVGNEQVTYSYNAVFVDKNAGTDKPVIVQSLALDSASAVNRNYVLAGFAQPKLTATIRPLALSPDQLQLTANSKTYDGNANAVGATASVSGILSGDLAIAVFDAASFSDRNAGNNKTVNFSGLRLFGSDAGNYLLPNKTTASADILPRLLAVSAQGVNKVYDGTVAASVTLLDDRIAGDQLATGYDASRTAFVDKNVGTGKRIDVNGIAITGGADAGNYRVGQNAGSATADITPASLQFSAVAKNKVYDGTNAASAEASFKAIGDDRVVAIYGNASFGDKNVGTGKEVAIPVLSLSGPDAGNYVINGPAKGAADITPRTLNVNATGVNKVYDGMLAASVILGDDRIAGDDVKTLYGTAGFADRNAGSGKAVSVANIALGVGTDARNYVLGNRSATTVADITPRALNVTASINSKTYDGSVAASAVLADDRIAGDDVKLGYSAAAFADANAGAGKAASVAGIALAGGADAANYRVANSVAAGAGTILKKPLAIVANADGKDFDGKPYAGGNGVAISGLVAGDDASVLAGTLRYGGDAQGAIAPGAYRITPSGLDAANYAPNFGDGLLTIRYASVPTVALGRSGQDDIYTALQQQMPNLLADADREERRLALSPVGGDGRLTVAGCGLRMPEAELMSSSCAPALDTSRRAVQP